MSYERWFILANTAVNVMWWFYAMVNQRWTRHRVLEMEKKLDEVLAAYEPTELEVA